MRFFTARRRIWCVSIGLFVVLAGNLEAQESTKYLTKNEIINKTSAKNPAKPLLTSILPAYYNSQNGIALPELIKRALSVNQDLAGARFEVEKAKARLQQAKMRPNPTLEVENSSGRLAANAGDREFMVGFALPIEIYGRRGARINFANIEIEASEAEIRNRERTLAASILSNYADALAFLREIDQLEKILELDLETARFVQIRVNEGETAPLELNLLQAEIERLRSRRQLAEGRLKAALTQLKLLAGIDFNENLQLREQINTANLPVLPASSENAVATALQTRPDIQLAQIQEQVATAGLRLVRAQSKPDLTAYTRYSQGQQQITTNTGNFPQADRALTFGVAVGLPVFNRNQGAKAEAEINIKQAQARRDYAERVVRSEVLAAFQRFEAANDAVLTLQNAAIPRSTQNVETFRKIYEIGEIRITELIAEQRRLLDTTRDLTEALTEKYKAQSDLIIAVGAGGILPEVK